MRLTKQNIRRAVRQWLLNPATEKTAEDMVRREAVILGTLTEEEEMFLYKELQLIAKLLQ